jgi:hypothetical protein
LQALLSLIYLTSSDIFALINYTGFATWVSVCNNCNRWVGMVVVLQFFASVGWIGDGTE